VDRGTVNGGDAVTNDWFFEGSAAGDLARPPPESLRLDIYETASPTHIQGASLGTSVFLKDSVLSVMCRNQVHHLFCSWIVGNGVKEASVLHNLSQYLVF
jgi:hypothetical protein